MLGLHHRQQLVTLFVLTTGGGPFCEFQTFPPNFPTFLSPTYYYSIAFIFEITKKYFENQDPQNGKICSDKGMIYPTT